MSITIEKDEQVTINEAYVLLGDINNDGEIDIGDVILALRMSVKLSVEIEGKTYSDPYPDWLIRRADYNNDGNVNIADVMFILRKSIGL
jgi:Ca2+-binding EF-hand superfamily protein